MRSATANLLEVLRYRVKGLEPLKEHIQGAGVQALNIQKFRFKCAR
jgi:hypothetical protein